MVYAEGDWLVGWSGGRSLRSNGETAGNPTVSRSESITSRKQPTATVSTVLRTAVRCAPPENKFIYRSLKTDEWMDGWMRE